MKAIDQIRVLAAAAWRSSRAARGGEPWPAHLVLRLDDFDAPGPTPPATLDLPGWHDRIVGVLAVTGPLPVRVLASAGNPLLPGVARFAGRLECPVTVRIGGTADRGTAEALVDAGVRRAVLVDPGVDDVAAMVAARTSRAAKLDVMAEISFRPGLDLPAIAGRLRGVGLDGVRIGAPWRGGPWTVDLPAWESSFHRTPLGVLRALRRFADDGPGVARTSGTCPVGGLRVEIGPDGAWSQCPFQPGHVAGGDFAEAWPALGDHRGRIRACGRACVHAELAPDDPGAVG